MKGFLYSMHRARIPPLQALVAMPTNIKTWTTDRGRGRVTRRCKSLFMEGGVMGLRVPGWGEGKVQHKTVGGYWEEEGGWVMAAMGEHITGREIINKRQPLLAYQRCWFDCSESLAGPVMKCLTLHWRGRPQLRPGIPVVRLIPYECMILQEGVKSRREECAVAPAAAACLSALRPRQHGSMRCIV